MKFIVNLVGTLVGLILIALLTVLLLAPETVITFLGRLEEVQLPVRLALVIVIYLVALALFSIRVRLTPRGKSDALTVRTSDTVASVSVESVRERVLKTVGEVPGVATVAAQVKSVGGRADIDLNVTTTDDKVNIPEKQREISRVIDQVIKKQLGLQMLGRPRINIQLGQEAKLAAPPLVSEPVRETPPPTYVPPVVPPSVSPIVESVPAVIPPVPLVASTEPLPEPEEQPRGFFSRFGLNEPRETEPESEVVEDTVEDAPEDDADSAFYSMLESEQMNDEPSLDQVDSSAIIIEEPILPDEHPDENSDKDSDKEPNI